jgi:hypothetical protein
MVHKHRRLVLLAALLPPLLISADADAQRTNSRTTGAAPPAEEPLAPQAPVGHRQPRAKDLPAPEQKTAAEREQERKDRELDKRLRICRNC